MKNFLFFVLLAVLAAYLISATVPLMPDFPLGTGLHFKSIWHGIVALTAIFGLLILKQR